MIIYISGPITGLPIEEARKNFKLKALELEAMGFTVINPMELPHLHKGEWSDYMREDITALMKCDSIYILQKWEKSKGAKIEVYLAHILGLMMFQEVQIEINVALFKALIRDQIKQRTLNLCDTCIKQIPTCNAKNPQFGSGKGNDNIYKCEAFINDVVL